VSELFSPIGQGVEKIKTWNPKQSGNNDLFDYIDLSSIDKQKKTINLSAVPKTEPSEAPSRARQIVKAGDVLVSTVRPNLNGVAIVPDCLDGATASTGYCVLRANQELLDSKYLYYWVRNSRFINDMKKKATGANYPAVSDKIIKESELPRFDIDEQRRIAAILDKADSIHRNRQQALQLSNDFLRSAFLDMFGDPVTNPKGWGVRTLESLVEKPITYGILKPEEYVPNGVAMLRIQDVKRGVIQTDDLHLVSERLSDQYSRTVLSGGEIVISLVGTIGLVALVPHSLSGANVHRNLGVIKLSDKRLIEFVTSFMQLPEFKLILDRVTKGGVHKLLNLADLKEVEVMVPDYEMIERFVDIKMKVRELQVKNYRFDSESLFCSLSHKAFSGEL
jgi:type I restriction enzyme, S subunit